MDMRVILRCQSTTGHRLKQGSRTTQFRHRFRRQILWPTFPCRHFISKFSHKLIWRSQDRQAGREQPKKKKDAKKMEERNTSTLCVAIVRKVSRRYENSHFFQSSILSSFASTYTSPERPENGKHDRNTKNNLCMCVCVFVYGSRSRNRHNTTRHNNYLPQQIISPRINDFSSLHSLRLNYCPFSFLFADRPIDRLTVHHTDPLVAMRVRHCLYFMPLPRTERCSNRDSEDVGGGAANASTTTHVGIS